MIAKLFYTLWEIFFATSLLSLSLTAQRIASINSFSVPYLYSFVVDNGYVYLGGEQVVETVNILDLTSVRTVNVPKFDEFFFCGTVSKPYCSFNVIDHIFPFADSLLACGSNGGVGGCSLFQGSPVSGFTSINNFTVPLSGDIQEGTSESSELTYNQNSIFVNNENDVIYTQYHNLVNSAFVLGLHNFADFRSSSAPTASSEIPEIISTFDTNRRSKTAVFFFNDPTVGRIFRHASTSTVDYDYINIPFTEIVQESSVPGLDYEYLTSSFHGRLARICANDLGQFAINQNSPFNPFIGTFNKITIDCRQALGLRYSTDSSYVSIALKEIFILNSTNIYGFFTSQNTAGALIHSSAVCKFISDRVNTGQDFNIETGFNSVYYRGYDSIAVSENTSWTCADPLSRVSGNLFDATIVNILHMTVVFNEASLAFDKHFEGIIMDVTSVTTSVGSQNITLFYATTFDGYLIKMKVDNCISVVAEFQVTNTKIINPQIQSINNVKYLFAISNNQLVKISLQLCNTYMTAISCYRDPECVWQNPTVSCIQYDLISVRDVPPDSELTVDDTCQLSLLSYTLESLNISLQCQVKLPDIEPNITITTISGASVATANSNYARHTTTYATILFTNLESLTGYRTTIELNYVFAIVPDLVLVAYTQFEQVVVTSLSLTPICPSASTISSINVTAPIDPYAVLTICAVCNSTHFCIATDTYNATVPYTFPWAECVLTTTLHNSGGAVVNSSICPPAVFNRCTIGISQQLNINFITTSTSVTVVLEDGISPLEFGIEKYTITLDGMDYTLYPSNVEINAIKPNTSLTIMYSATTQCGLTFTYSETISTNPDWSQVANCQLTNDSTQLILQFTILNTGLCQSDLTNCMEVDSACTLNFTYESSDTLTYTGSVEEGRLCIVNVFPSGEPTLTAYYGCTTSLYVPITFRISNINIGKVTTNSVAATYSILPSGMHYERTVILLNSSDSVLQQYTAYLPTGSDLTAGFGNLDQNTDYKIRIGMLTKFFTTNQSSLFNLSCSSISSYGAELVPNTDTYNVLVTRNDQCPLGKNAQFICYGNLSSLNITKVDSGSIIFSLSYIRLTDNFAFGLFANITVCPPLNDTNYRFIYANSIFQSQVNPPTTTSIPTTTPIIPPYQPITLIFASLILFYLAVGTSSFTVLTSAGGLVVLFGLIVCYPKLLKKQELKTAIRQDREIHELTGMNNPISDSS